MWTQEELEEMARDADLDLVYPALDSLASHGITWTVECGGGNIPMLLVMRGGDEIAEIYADLECTRVCPAFQVSWNTEAHEAPTLALVDDDNLAGLILTLAYSLAVPTLANYLA